jgi:hypothetical protein
VVSPELLHAGCAPAERVGFWKGVNVRPHFHGPSPETVLCGGNVSLGLRYAGRNGEPRDMTTVMIYLSMGLFTY